MIIVMDTVMNVPDKKKSSYNVIAAYGDFDAEYCIVILQKMSNDGPEDMNLFE